MCTTRLCDSPTPVVPHPPQPIRVGTFGTSLIPRTRLRTRCCGPQGARHCRVVIVRRVGQIDLWRFELDCRRTLFGAAIGTDSDLRVQVVDALLIHLVTPQNAVRVWTRWEGGISVLSPVHSSVTLILHLPNDATTNLHPFVLSSLIIVLVEHFCGHIHSIRNDLGRVPLVKISRDGAFSYRVWGV